MLERQNLVSNYVLRIVFPRSTVIVILGLDLTCTRVAELRMG